MALLFDQYGHRRLAGHVAARLSCKYERGTTAADAAMKANRHWWREQNRSLGRECRTVPGCWLPPGHEGHCQPGDYVKVEFRDEASDVGEWMWLRVDRCDDEKQLVYGTLDNEPLKIVTAGFALDRARSRRSSCASSFLAALGPGPWGDVREPFALSALPTTCHRSAGHHLPDLL